jgi:hypothetical protein
MEIGRKRFRLVATRPIDPAEKRQGGHQVAPLPHGIEPELGQAELGQGRDAVFVLAHRGHRALAFQR